MLDQFGNNWIQKIPRTAKLDSAVAVLGIFLILNYFQIGQHVVLLHIQIVSFFKQLADFASDIGGQLGLWIGFSVLTIAEFLEFVMLLIGLAVKKCSSREKIHAATMEMNPRDSR